MYSPSQAKTHLVSGAGALILETASDTEVSVASLLVMTAAEDACSFVDDAAAEGNLQQTIDGLVTAGLLRNTK